MAAGRTSHVKTQRTRGFMAFLVSAACEWFLISFLFIDALLSYLLTKFASYFELQAPCVFCSRLDRVLSGENPEYYQTLLCNNHRSEVSSLISCHIHNKVADGHGMCDDCLLSLTKANPETQRLLVGKLGLDHGDFSFESSSERDLFSDSFASRTCTCCGKLWKPEHSAQRSFLLQSPGSATSNSGIHLPAAPRQSHLNNCCNSKCCGSVTSPCVGKNNCNSLLSYVGFTELKLVSDSQSDSYPEERNSLIQSPSPDAMDISNGESEKREAMTLDATHSVGASPEKSLDASQASDNGLQSIKNQEEGLKKISTSAEAFKGADLMVNDPAHASPSHKFLINASKFSVTAEEREVDRVKEELKLLSSLKSSPRWSNLSDMYDAYLPETQADASSSNGTQALHKSVSVDSGLGFLAGSNTNEIEGESLVDQLKRQIEHVKKCMSSLYEELEEERNAAAIAANEAMSMINRLQKEKSVLQMEALQYLRMMDEQAEHDAEALEKADILLSEKEKEIQDLEAEIEIYRMNLPDEPLAENIYGQTEETD